MTNEKRNSLNKVEQKKASTSRRERRKRLFRKRNRTEEKGIGYRFAFCRFGCVSFLSFCCSRRSDFRQMIGYGYIGDGEIGDVLKKETWIHILDIIKGKES